jgi:hypothetical protein
VFISFLIDIKVNAKNADLQKIGIKGGPGPPKGVLEEKKKWANLKSQF